MTLHQVSSAANGCEIMTVDRVTVHRQNAPKVAKNGKLYSIVILKSAGLEMMLSLWESAAKWKLPLGVELTLRGKLSKDDYDGKACLRCEELTAPEGAVEFEAGEVQAIVTKPSIKDCLEAGIRAAELMHNTNLPQLEAAAFTFAANACLNGVRPE